MLTFKLSLSVEKYEKGPCNRGLFNAAMNYLFNQLRRYVLVNSF